MLASYNWFSTTAFQAVNSGSSPDVSKFPSSNGRPSDSLSENIGSIPIGNYGPIKHAQMAELVDALV